MSDSEKMKSLVFLFIALQLIESTAGSCQLQATLRTTEVQTKQGKDSGMVHQTQLELLCSNTSCPMTNFTTCDTYTEFDIPRDCTGDGCSREFNLCRNRCTNDRQERSTEPPTVPFSKATTDSIMTIPVNACPTNTSCTPITITITTTVSPSNTASTIGQSSFNITSVIRSTITKIQEIPFTIVHTTTPTTWTTCPQNTIELMTTTTIRPELSESMPCTPIISTKFIATTVLSPLQSCTPEVSQFTTMPKLNITKFSTISLVLESCSCNKPGVPAQGTGLSVTISALGCLLGLSLVFLALVTAGWVWTCWTVRKRGGMTINSKQNNFPNTPGTVTINNNTDTLRRLQNPLYEETVINRLLSSSEAELHTGQGENEETGPTYEIIPLPDTVIKKTSKKNENIQLQNEETSTAGEGVSVGGASSKNDNTTQDNIRLVGGGNMNHYYLPDEKTNGESSERSGDRDQENNYNLLGNAEEERERVRENVYHVLENPLDTEEDYADPDEDEMNNIYHVLEGPTPEREEESEGDKAESEKTEREEERDKDEVEEPLTEPTAYEIPLVSGSKHNSTVLQ